MIDQTQAVGGPRASETTLGMYQFTRYVKLVLPLDGFVFWVRADLVSKKALFNAMLIGDVEYDEWTNAPPVTVEVRGTLHYETTEHQDEVKTYSSNRVFFNTMAHVNNLNAKPVMDAFNTVTPSAIWIGTFQGVRYAFSQRQNFFFQAGEGHYVGDALYSTMETQIIDSVAGFNQRQIVSNSLPLWLSFNDYSIFYGIQTCPVKVYPSFLVPSNLPPPFAVVHVIPEETRAIGAAPRLSSRLSHSQLVRDLVRVTLYGARNDEAMDFVDFVDQYTLDNDLMGIMNMPTVRDDKESQPELQILAQRKSVDFEVSYYQNRARDIAQQLILEAIPTFVIADFVEPPPSGGPLYVTEDSLSFYVTEDSQQNYVAEE